MYIEVETKLTPFRKRQFSNAFPNALISLKISLQFVPKDRLKNIPALVQIMAWCRPGDKPLSEPMLGRSLTHTCVTGRQWVKEYPGLDISQNFPLPDFQNFALFSIQTRKIRTPPFWDTPHRLKYKINTSKSLIISLGVHVMSRVYPKQTRLRSRVLDPRHVRAKFVGGLRRTAASRA